jgi:hypothetical protein
VNWVHARTRSRLGIPDTISTRIDQHVRLYFRKFTTKIKYPLPSVVAIDSPALQRCFPTELFRQDNLNKLTQSVIQGLKLDLERSEEYFVSDADWARPDMKLAIFTSLTRLRSWLVHHSASLTKSEWDSWQILPAWPQVPNSGLPESTAEIRRWEDMCSGEISTGRDNTPDTADKDSDLFLSDIKVLSEIWANRQGRDHSTPESELADQLATEQDAEGENEDDAATPLFNLWAQFTNQPPIFQQKCRKTKKQPRKRHGADITQDHETEEPSRKRHKADITPAHETEEPSRKHHKADVSPAYETDERPMKRHKADVARDHKVPSLNMPLHPSPDGRNSADDAHYQGLELDLMNKARYKTQTVDEFLEIHLAEFKLKSSHKQQRADNHAGLFCRLDVPSIMAGLHRVQNRMANEPGWSSFQIEFQDFGFSNTTFYRFKGSMPFLQQLGTGLRRWKGATTFTSKGQHSEVENLLRWKLSSLVDEVWWITDKDWETKVANQFDAYICSLSGLTDSKFRFDPSCLIGYRTKHWRSMDAPHVCGACNRTMPSHYQVVLHHQLGCGGGLRRFRA